MREHWKWHRYQRFVQERQLLPSLPQICGCKVYQSTCCTKQKSSSGYSYKAAFSGINYQAPVITTKVVADFLTSEGVWHICNWTGSNLVGHQTDDNNIHPRIVNQHSNISMVMNHIPSLGTNGKTSGTLFSPMQQHILCWASVLLDSTNMSSCPMNWPHSSYATLR